MTLRALGLWGGLWLGCLLAGAAAVQAAEQSAAQGATQGLRLTYDAGGAPVTVTRDGAGTVQFDGLPYPGLVLYRPETGVIYYQHPSEAMWLTVQPGQGALVSATVVKGPMWQPWEGRDTYRWDVKAGGMDTPDGRHAVQCDQWFSSTYAAQQAGLTAADFSRVMAVLAWLNSGGQTVPCERLVVSRQQGMEMGLPLRWTTPNGPWQLSELVRTAVPTIQLPDAVRPVDDTLRLQLLLGQFGPDERKNFLQANGGLPVAQQLLALEAALGGVEE